MATVECLVCGHVGSTKTKGSFAITLILLWFAILPGIIYEVWRRSGGKVCSACGSHSVRLYTPVNRVVVQPASQSTTVEPTKNYGKSKLVANDTFSYSAGERLNQENQGENPEFKDCPFCAEKIKLAAIKYKHCGSMVEE